MKKQKFVIYHRIHGNSGGAIALHALCKNLCELGYDARIFYGKEYYIKKVLVFIARIFNKNWFKKWDYTPTIKCRHKLTKITKKNTIVVYPDAPGGNPLHAKKVVRWLLYYYNPQEGTYSKDDLFIAYRKQFNNIKFNPKEYTATVSYVDLNTYKRYNMSSDRSGTCYILRKGRWRQDLPKTFDGPIIDAMSEKQKVECFNTYKYCVSYDTQTTYSSIAAMCGCISVIVPEPGKSRYDYRTPDENPGQGLAYGFSEQEIEYAINTREKIKEKFELSNINAKKEAEKFAEICLEYFSKK